jgi:hypothetical protein
MSGSASQMSGSENIRHSSFKEKVRKMKTNVINSQFAIDYHDGIFEIIGKSQGAVVFRLCGNSVSDLKRDQPPFCKNVIFTNDVDSRKGVLIFEYSLKGELRNPRKLLKSVRNKLVQAGFRNQHEEDEDFHKLYTMPDREEHRMFQDDPGDRSEPLPKVCYT